MKNRVLTVLALSFALLATPALALDLATARSQGLVGEKTDGYIKALKPEASGVASEVNSKRKAEYARISKENGQPVDVVAKLAAEQIINGLPSGAMYQDAAGNWKTR